MVRDLQTNKIWEILDGIPDPEVPIISIVIGEGASGGALGIGLADKIICLRFKFS